MDGKIIHVILQVFGCDPMELAHPLVKPPVHGIDFLDIGSVRACMFARGHFPMHHVLFGGEGIVGGLRVGDERVPVERFPPYPSAQQPDNRIRIDPAPFGNQQDSIVRTVHGCQYADLFIADSPDIPIRSPFAGFPFLRGDYIWLPLG